MATEQELIEALKAADAAGNVEDAQKLAGALQSMQAVAAQPTFESSLPEAGEMGLGDGLGFLNKGIAETIGAPVDLISGAIRMEGKGREIFNQKLHSVLPDFMKLPGDAPSYIPNFSETLAPEDSFGGSTSVKRGMELIGAPIPDREPEGFVENVLAVGGEVSGFTLPAAALARRFQAASGVGGALANSMNRAWVEKPIQTALIEAGGVVGAGAGRHIANENDMSAGGSLTTELVGGALGSFMTSGGITRRIIDFAKNGGARLLFPFTEPGAEMRASRRLKELATDPVAAAKAIEDLKGTNLLPSSRTGEPGLMALERTVLDGDPALAAKVEETTSEGMAKLVESIRHSGSVKTTKRFIEAKRERLFTALDARVEQASQKAARALDDLGEDASTADLGQVMRDQLDEALADAKIQENMLWAAVPQDAVVPVGATRKAYGEALSSLSIAQRDDMPMIASQVVEALDGKTTELAELDGFYKKLGEVSRQARMDGNRNQARLAETLREAILEDIGNAKGSPEVRQALKEARAFSRQVADRFRKGPVGKLLETDKVGAPRVPAELTLDTTVGRSGNRGKLGNEALQDAVGPLAMEPVQAYLKKRFAEAAVVDGVVSPAKAEAFMRANAPALDAFPYLKDQLQVARNLEDISRKVKQSSDGMRRAFQNPAVSDAARFLGAPVDKEIKAIFSAPDAEKTMGELVKMARKDRSGKALQGIKAGVSDYLINRAKMASFDTSGRNPVSGQALQKALADPTLRATLTKVYNPSEMRKMERSIEMLAAVNKASQSKRKLPEIIEDRPARIIQVIGRVIGAKLGASMSQGGAGASIQAAQIGSAQAKGWLQRLTTGKAERLLVEAIQDPELMKHLLVDYRSAEQIKRTDRYLRNWSASRGLELFEEEE